METEFRLNLKKFFFECLVVERYITLTKTIINQASYFNQRQNMGVIACFILTQIIKS